MKFFCLISYLLVFYTFFIPFRSFSQSNLQVEDIIQLFDEKYGVDYNLVNGKKYVNFYLNAGGHPFFEDDKLHKGWVKINGIEYPALLLNYDIYNQEVIVEYSSDLIGKQRYIVPNLFLEGFSLNNREFAKIKIGEAPERFYEIISWDKTKIVFTHDKTYKLDRGAANWGYIFSEIITRKYIIKNDELVKFRNNRSFRKEFPKELKDDIKSFMKTNRINIKSSEIERIKLLMNFINQL